MKIKIVLISIFSLLLFSCAPKYSKYFITEPETKVTAGQINPINCDDYENYAPDVYSQMRYVRVNFHFMCTTDGKNAFTEEEGKIYIRDLINACNYKLANNAQMSLPEGNETPALQTKYRIVLTGDPTIEEDGIYFHYDDSTAWYIKNKKNGLYAMGDQRPFIYASGLDTIFNIFIINQYPDSTTGKVNFSGSASGVSFGHNIKIFAAYQNWENPDYINDKGERTKGAGFYAGLVNHEIGHSLGLMHTWKLDDGCDDTPKNPGCWGPTDAEPCLPPTSNNMMDYNGCQCAISPCQLGRIHYNFWKENSSQRTGLIDTWCDYDSTHAIIIQRNDTVTFRAGKEFNASIIIEEGATLIIQCTLSLADNAKIIVKPLGKLILDGGTITNRCNGKWKGIEIWESRKHKFKGAVEIINGGLLENVQMYYSNVN